MELIEKIAKMSSCYYLSDIIVKNKRADILNCIEKIYAEEYPLKEWEKLIKYMQFEECKFETAGEARKYIQECLK